jgi:hypothetical protein
MITFDTTNTVAAHAAHLPEDCLAMTAIVLVPMLLLVTVAAIMLDRRADD